MKKLFAIVLLANLSTYTMEKVKKDKKSHIHHKHHKHHDKITLYPDVDKKDIHIIVTDPTNKQDIKIQQAPNEGFFSKSFGAITAVFRYLGK